MGQGYYFYLQDYYFYQQYMQIFVKQSIHVDDINFSVWIYLVLGIWYIHMFK